MQQFDPWASIREGLIGNEVVLRRCPNQAAHVVPSTLQDRLRRSQGLLLGNDCQVPRLQNDGLLSVQAVAREQLLAAAVWIWK